MSLQFDVTAQNAVLSALVAAIGASPHIQFYNGALPANCATNPQGVKVVDFALAAVWASGPAGGQLTLSNIPLQAIAAASGTVNYFRIVDSIGMCHMQGTVTGTGGGGDFELDNPNVTQGQTVTIGSWTIVAPGS